MLSTTRVFGVMLSIAVKLSNGMYCRRHLRKGSMGFCKGEGPGPGGYQPHLVSGPFLQSSLNTSTEILLDFLSGTAKTYPNFVNGWVGVKDVALAHVLAFENPNARGRYICSTRVLRSSDFIAILAKLYPSYPIHTKCADETSPRAPYYTLNTQKLQNLGFPYQPLEEVIQETVDCLKD